MHADIKATMQMEILTRGLHLQWCKYFKLPPVKITPIDPPTVENAVILSLDKSSVL